MWSNYAGISHSQGKMLYGCWYFGFLLFMLVYDEKTLESDHTLQANFDPVVTNCLTVFGIIAKKASFCDVIFMGGMGMKTFYKW